MKQKANYYVLSRAMSLLLALLMAFTVLTPAAEAFAATVPSVSISWVRAKPSGFQPYWNEASNVTGYQIQYATKSDFSNAATVTVSDSAATDKIITGRASECKYYVRVRGYITKNGKNTYGSWSSSKTVTTRNKNEADSTYCKSLTALPSAFSITLNKVSNATGYQVRYATKSNFSNAKTETFKGSSNTSMTITGRASNCKYYVQARTYRTVNGKNYYSAWSGTKDVTTRNSNEAYPASIKSLTAIEYGFTINWDKVNNASGYEVRYATKSDMSNAATPEQFTSSKTSGTIKGRAGDCKYYVQIRTYRTVSGKNYYSAWSKSTEVTTLKSKYQPIAPTFSVVAGKYSFTLSWTPVANAVTYEVQYATKSDFSNANSPLVSFTASDRSGTISNRAGNCKYYVRVRAVNTVNNKTYYSNWSSTQTVTTKSDKPVYNEGLKFTYVDGVSEGFIYAIPNQPYCRLYEWVSTNVEMGAWSSEKANKYMNKLEKAYKECGITDDMNDIERFLLITKWISGNISYDKTLEHNNILDALDYRECTCGGYATLFNDLCYLAGIPAYYVTSSEDNSWYHAWNLVKLNGYWYAMEPQSGGFGDLASNISGSFADGSAYDNWIMNMEYNREDHGYYCPMSLACEDSPSAYIQKMAEPYKKMYNSSQCLPHGTVYTLDAMSDLLYDAMAKISTVATVERNIGTTNGKWFDEQDILWYHTDKEL